MHLHSPICRALLRTRQLFIGVLATAVMSAAHGGQSWDTDELLEFAALSSPRQAGALREMLPLEKAPPYEWGGVYKGDFWTGVSGRLRHADALVYLGTIDLTLTVAGESAFDLPGSTLFIHVQNTHGGKPNRRIGTVQGIDNIEVDTHTTKILQLWIQQQFWDDRLSLLAGLYDLNTEFYVTEASGLFIHPSFGIGAEMAQTGQNGPSIFPTTSLAGRVRVAVREQFYFQVAGMDAVPGDPDDPRGTHIQLRGRDGLLWAAEAGTQTESEGRVNRKLALGFWQYSKQAATLSAAADETRTNRGLYALWEEALIKGPSALNAFVRAGVADGALNPLSSSMTLGLSGRGLLSSRPQDSFGFGIAAARYGSKYRDMEAAPRYELAYELTYRFEMQGFALQPDFMLIESHDDGRRADIVAGLRIEAKF